MLRTLDDPATRELVLIRGRRPRVRTADGWSELTFEIGAAAWEGLWESIAERTGLPAGSSGHTTHQASDGLVVEAMTPPLAADPVLHLRRRPPQTTLEGLIDEGLLEGDAAAVRDALDNRRGILICGDRGTGRTTILEALAAATPGGERVATIESLPQLRVDEALRLRLDPANPSPALSAARAAMAEWLVLDDAPPAAVGAAIIEAEANRAAVIATARTADADAWLDQVARSIAHEVGDPEAAVRAALPVVIRVSTGPSGEPTARVERS